MRRLIHPFKHRHAGGDRLLEAVSGNNRLWVFLMGMLAPIAGSSVTMLFLIQGGWSVLTYLLGLVPGGVTRHDRFLASSCAFFALLVVFCSWIGGGSEVKVSDQLWVLLYLAPLVVALRLRQVADDLLGLFCLGAGIGSILAVLVALFQVGVMGERPVGGNGNSAVFAIVCLCTAAFSILNIDAHDRLIRRIAVLGAAGGLLCVLLSGTRGVWLAALAVAACMALYARPFLRKSVSPSLIAGLALMAMAAGLVGFVALDQKFGSLIKETNDLFGGQADGSSYSRLAQWIAAIPAMLDSPLVGYGVQNRMTPVLDTIGRFGGPFFVSSHPHNFLIALMLDGGVFVLTAYLAMLAAPIKAVMAAPRDGSSRKRLYAGVMLACAYAGSGLTQLVYRHDLMDVMFVFCASLIVASIPPEEIAEDGEARPAACVDAAKAAGS